MHRAITDFYDKFSERLLADYVYGNPRVEAAIIHALQWISPNAKRILDIGCGIGWSTHEIKRHRPQAFILGVDLSPKMAELAHHLFGEDKIEFVAHDACDWNPVFEPPYDAIVLLDVYEHIPKDRRLLLHQVLKRALGLDGVIVLTFPSMFHQRLLRSFHPEELQPVDEDVTEDDIGALAQDIEGKMTYWSSVSIWHPGDYIHAVIARGRCAGENPVMKRHISLEPQRVRQDRIRKRLQVRVTREGVLLKDTGEFTVCIFSPNKNAYSETFIRTHIERLPAKVKVLYGGWFSDI